MKTREEMMSELEASYSYDLFMMSDEELRAEYKEKILAAGLDQ